MSTLTIESGKEPNWEGQQSSIGRNVNKVEPKDGAYATFETYSFPWEDRYNYVNITINLAFSINLSGVLTKLESNKIYTFNVIYGGEYAELSDITISAWDVVEGSNTLETEED